MSSSGLLPLILQSLFILLVIAVTVYKETANLQRLKRYTSSPARLSTQRTTIACLWLYAILALALAYPKDLFHIVGGDMVWLLHNATLRIATIGLLTIAFGLNLVPIIVCGFNAGLRKKYGKAAQKMQYFLPVSPAERRWWILISLSAGICEEIVFRGFLMQYFGGQLHHFWSMGMTSAWLLSSVLFGLGHYYQGRAGIVRTGLVGALMGLLAILSGNLLLPIIMHAIVDMAVLWVYKPMSDNPAAAQQLIEGCDPSLTSLAAS
jgi:membrane protease YdiL (CAAX protease family)